MTNEAWDRFARDNHAFPLTAVAPGANYLQICKQAASQGDSDAQAVVDGIETVVAGYRSSFQFEYSCHSLTERRWFLMNVSPLKGPKTGAVITHTNITDRKLAEIAIRTSESTIRSLLDSSTQSVVAVSPNGKIVLVNGNTQTMFGYTREELLGQAIEILIPDGFRAKHAVHNKGYFANPQNRPMWRGLDLEGLRKDGTTFPLEVSLSAIETTTGKLAVAFVNDITVRKRLEQAERAHTQEVQALAAGLMTAQEEERRRVSRELHDTICQQLASLAIDIAELAAHPAPPPKERLRRLRALEARVVKASEEARHLAYELHPSVLDDLGLVSALRALCREFSAKRQHMVEFISGGLPGTVPREVAACLYRVTQEALQNATKHSTADHISVALTSGEGTMSLSIEDDGVGFDIERVKGRGGLGLIGMEERVRMVNGKLSVASQAGRGTRVALTVPLLGANL